MTGTDVFLLRLANSGDYAEKRVFYQLKDQLLERFGQPDGYDLQEIELECWNCRGNPEGCYRCTNGIWETKRYYLLRYRLHEHLFHRPVGYIPSDLLRQMPRQVIHGHIRHDSVDPVEACKAALRLLYKYDRQRWFALRLDRIKRRWRTFGLNCAWRIRRLAPRWLRRLPVLYRLDKDVPF